MGERKRKRREENQTLEDRKNIPLGPPSMGPPLSEVGEVGPFVLKSGPPKIMQ